MSSGTLVSSRGIFIKNEYSFYNKKGSKTSRLLSKEIFTQIVNNLKNTGEYTNQYYCQMEGQLYSQESQNIHQEIVTGKRSKINSCFDRNP